MVRGNGMSRNRRGTRRPKVSNPMPRLRLEHRLDFRGVIPRGRTDPPRVLINPWNSLVLSTIIIGAATSSNRCITFTDIDSMVNLQLGTTNASRIYRIRRSQVWHIIPNGELNNRVRVKFYSLISETSSCDIVKTLAACDDYGTPARNATAAFVWPRTHQSNVFSQTSSAVVLRLTLEPAQQVLVHIELLWKPIGGTSTIHKCDPSGKHWSIEKDETAHLFHSDLSSLHSEFDSLSLNDLAIDSQAQATEK